MLDFGLKEKVLEAFEKQFKYNLKHHHQTFAQNQLQLAIQTGLVIFQKMDFPRSYGNFYYSDTQLWIN